MSRLAHVLEAMRQPPQWAAALVLGQCPRGDLWLPCVHDSHMHGAQWYCRPYNRRNPAHWPYMALTLLTGWVVWLDA